MHERENMHKIFLICTIVAELACSWFLTAQDAVPIASTESPNGLSSMLLSNRLDPTAHLPPLGAPAVLPSMSSELALQVYQQGVGDQTRKICILLRHELHPRPTTRHVPIQRVSAQL